MRIYRKREERIERGKQLYESDREQLIGRLEAEDILWYLGVERNHIAICLYNILKKTKHEKDKDDFLVLCKDFVETVEKVAFIKKPLGKKQVPVMVEEQINPPANNTYQISLSENTKTFYIQLAKKNNTTVTNIIVKLLEDKARDCMERALNRIKQQAMEMAIEEVDL